MPSMETHENLWCFLWKHLNLTQSLGNRYDNLVKSKTHLKNDEFFAHISAVFQMFDNLFYKNAF